jgi:hypothetical protein
MARTTSRKAASGLKRRVSRAYRVSVSKVHAAKRALGAATDSETIERALDLVVFRRALIDGTRAMQGIEITSPDAER